MQYATFALALSLLGRIALKSDLLFYKEGQVVRSGTSHKAALGEQRDAVNLLTYSLTGAGNQVMQAHA